MSALATKWAADLRVAFDAMQGTLELYFDATVALGNLLMQAKGALPQGQFGMLFHDHPAAVIGALPMSHNWGLKIMAIARSDLLLQHRDRLPMSIWALYEISKSPAQAVATAIESGQIHPNMRQVEATRLCRSWRDLPATSDEQHLERLGRDVARPLCKFMRRIPRLRLAAVQVAYSAIAAAAASEVTEGDRPRPLRQGSGAESVTTALHSGSRVLPGGGPP